MMKAAKIKEGIANAEWYHNTLSAFIHTNSRMGMGARNTSFFFFFCNNDDDDGNKSIEKGGRDVRETSNSIGWLIPILVHRFFRSLVDF